MRKFDVTFEVFLSNTQKTYRTITVEAGNKKIAALRAMNEINKIGDFFEYYKNVVKIVEVA